MQKLLLMGRRKKRNRAEPLLLLESPSSTIERKIPVEDISKCSELICATPECIDPGQKEIWVNPQFPWPGNTNKISKRIKNEESRSSHTILKNSKSKKVSFMSSINKSELKEIKTTTIEKSSDRCKHKNSTDHTLEPNACEKEDADFNMDHNQSNCFLDGINENLILQSDNEKLVSEVNNSSHNTSLNYSRLVHSNPSASNFLNGCIEIPREVLVLVPDTPADECGLTLREKQLRCLNSRK